MINIVLFGAPGCGKGTQAQRLKEHYGIDHVSTGEVIRDEIRRGTELGRSMEQYIKEGKLAPDEIVIGMIANYVSEHKDAKGCIFDGFPRTTVQAEESDKILAKEGLKVDIMVDIHVPEEELVRRILLRGKDSGRADDASEEVIRGRLDVYHKQTAWWPITTPGRTSMHRWTAWVRWTRSSTGSRPSSTPSSSNLLYCAAPAVSRGTSGAAAFSGCSRTGPFGRIWGCAVLPPCPQVRTIR